MSENVIFVDFTPKHWSEKLSKDKVRLIKERIMDLKDILDEGIEFDLEQEEDLLESFLLRNGLSQKESDIEIINLVSV